MSDHTTFGNPLFDAQAIKNINQARKIKNLRQIMDDDPNADEEPIAPPEGFVDMSTLKEEPVTAEDIATMTQAEDSPEPTQEVPVAPAGLLNPPIDIRVAESEPEAEATEEELPPLYDEEDIPEDAKQLAEDLADANADLDPAPDDDGEEDTEEETDWQLPEPPEVLHVRPKLIDNSIDQGTLAEESDDTPIGLITDEEETVSETTQEQKPTIDTTPLKNLGRLPTPESRRPDRNTSDAILRYTEDGREVRSRTSYNVALTRIHRNWWNDKGNNEPQREINIPLRAKVRKNDAKAYIWDEGGCDSNGRGFAVTAASATGQALDPLLVVIPELDYAFYDDIVFANWHHAKLPVTVNDYILAASRNPQDELLVTIYRINAVHFADTEKTSGTIKADVDAVLVAWYEIEGNNSTSHALESIPFDEEHPAFQAVMSQCVSEEAMRPAYCQEFTTTYGRDFNHYLNDKKFDDMFHYFEGSTQELNTYLDDVTKKLFFEYPGKQIRLYRVLKFFPNYNDISIFYYVVAYSQEEKMYTHRIDALYVTVNAETENIVLMGDPSKTVYTYSELLNEIQSHSRNNQLIAEYRRVTPGTVQE